MSARSLQQQVYIACPSDELLRVVGDEVVHDVRRVLAAQAQLAHVAHVEDARRRADRLVLVDDAACTAPASPSRRRGRCGRRARRARRRETCGAGARRTWGAHSTRARLFCQVPPSPLDGGHCTACGGGGLRITLPGPGRLTWRSGNQVHVPSGLCSTRPPGGAGGSAATAVDPEGDAEAELSAGAAEALAAAAVGEGEGPTSTVGAAGGCEGLLSQPDANVTTNDAASAFFRALMSRHHTTTRSAQLGERAQVTPTVANDHDLQQDRPRLA